MGGGGSIKNFSDKWVWSLAKFLIYSLIFVIFMSLHENCRQEMGISDRQCSGGGATPLPPIVTRLRTRSETSSEVRKYSISIFFLTFSVFSSLLSLPQHA